MQHYLLPAAVSTDCAHQCYPANLARILIPVAHQAVQSQSSIKAQLPFRSYSLKVAAEQGCAVFDVSRGQFVVSFNAVVWDESQQVRCWERLETIYLQLAREFNVVQSLPVAQMPENLPWIATLELNFPGKEPLPWLREVEECFASGLIQSSTAKWV